MNTSLHNSASDAEVVPESRQAGASLVEAVLFLVIVVVILIGIFGLFSGAFSTAKVQTETNNMSALSGDVENVYATNHDYGAADITASLVSTRNAPTPMIVGAGLVNSWGGAVTVTGASSVFTISSASIPQKECIQLAQIAINPTAVSINGAAQTLPLTVPTVTAACSSATSNAITWSLH
jgi:type II secretory pathway pseudopilin PulG